MDKTSCVMLKDPLTSCASHFTESLLGHTTPKKPQASQVGRRQAIGCSTFSPQDVSCDVQEHCQKLQIHPAARRPLAKGTSRAATGPTVLHPAAGGECRCRAASRA